MIYSIFKLTTKRGLETSLKESKSKYDVAHWLEELARTSVSFKLAGVTDLPLERTDESVKSYISARESHFKILVSQYSLMILFKVLVAAGLLIVGSILVMEQQMNIGQFVAAELIILLVLGSVEKLILCLESIYDVLTALEKVGQVTDLELELNTGMDITEKINNQPLSVELSQVNFSYPGEKRLIFKDASLKINAGDRVMIMGNSDSGKTTLLYLFAALYKVQSGSISYNNLPMGNLNPNLLRSVIGDCLMDELLFEGTILENITMGRENATFDNVAWAIDNLGLTDFIKSLPSGYDTEIYPQGKQFAKGIVDKLIMARSIADKPRLLLIKDAFTSLVGTEREKIMNFLTAPENPWTLIISSRDQSLKPKMNRVIVADNNVLTEITQ